MIKPGRYDFELYKGTTLRESFIWQPGGQTVDLTGWGGRAQVRESLSESTIDLNLNSVNGGVLINVPQSIITLYAPDSMTNQLRAWKYVYAVQLVSPVGDTLPFLEGYITVIESGIK